MVFRFAIDSCFACYPVESDFRLIVTMKQLEIRAEPLPDTSPERFLNAIALGLNSFRYKLCKRL
jgi:hypothetical protein